MAAAAALVSLPGVVQQSDVVFFPFLLYSPSSSLIRDAGVRVWKERQCSTVCCLVCVCLASLLLRLKLQPRQRRLHFPFSLRCLCCSHFFVFILTSPAVTVLVSLDPERKEEGAKQE